MTLSLDVEIEEILIKFFLDKDNAQCKIDNEYKNNFPYKNFWVGEVIECFLIEANNDLG
ncbi:MAG: hypothetical protein KatS3mg035_1007 [Bacteroidia bacterium]|nr:MAG: hypothetical protein KatS3mg035_1007 [Bacteroidia bacterium]